jgi:hypothetical protein
VCVIGKTVAACNFCCMVFHTVKFVLLKYSLYYKIAYSIMQRSYVFRFEVFVIVHQIVESCLSFCDDVLKNMSILMELHSSDCGLWTVTPCTLVHEYQCFGGTFVSIVRATVCKKLKLSLCLIN